MTHFQDIGRQWWHLEHRSQYFRLAPPERSDEVFESLFTRSIRATKRYPERVPDL